MIADFQRSGMHELHVRAADFEIYLSADPAAPGLDAQVIATPATSSPKAEPQRPAAAASHPPVEAAANSTVSEAPAGAIIVSAPYLGTFYRSPKPGSPVYVDVGSVVTAESELCLVEVMKLFTAVRADVAGIVHAILATDGQMVEADQPLFIIVPA
nr:biotin/lipoyl-containing protein [Sphingobium boeckii]